MKRLAIMVLAVSSAANGEAPSEGTSPLPQLVAELIQEVKQLRKTLERQQASLAALEGARMKGGRVAVLESRLEQLDEELAQERRRANELQTLAGAATEEDRRVLTEQLRRALEAVADMEAKRARLQSELSAASSEQDNLLKSIVSH